MSSANLFAINDFHKVVRIESHVRTPGRLQDRLHFLRRNSVRDLRFKQIGQQKKVAVLPSVSLTRLNSLKILSRARVSLLPVPVRTQQQLLHNHTHYHHQTMIETAIKKGSTYKFLQIMAHCKENCKAFSEDKVISGVMHSGMPYLIAAIQEHRLEMVRLLILKGASIHVCGAAPHKFPAVIYAVLTGYIPMLELLIENGAVCTEHDVKLLKLRCRYQQRGKSLPNEPAVLQWLNKYWSHKLLKATLMGDDRAVLVILGMNEHSKICNGRDHKRNAPIHVACAMGKQKIVELLLKHSPKTMFLSNGSWMKPIECAFVNDRLNVCAFLMRKGARMNVKEFKKTLESHLPTEHNTKMDYIERFASLILHSVDGPNGVNKSELLPIITSHIKKLNANAVLVMRDIVQMLLSTSCEEILRLHGQQTPTSFHGPHAISNELIQNYLDDKRKMKRAQSRVGSLPLSPIRRHKSLKTLRVGKLGRKLSVSRSMPDLTRSNIGSTTSHTAKMTAIARGISESRVRFAKRLDDVISVRLKESEKNRKFRATKKKALRWKRASLN